VSELRPQADILFIILVIYEHGEPGSNVTDRGKSPIRPPELSGNSTCSHLVAKQEKLATEMMNLALRSISIFAHIS
jgi:hypothetical protein